MRVREQATGRNTITQCTLTTRKREREREKKPKKLEL